MQRVQTALTKDWPWAVAATAGCIGLGWLVVRLSTARLDLRPLPFFLIVVTAGAMAMRERVARGTGLSPLMMALAAYVVIFGLVPLADLALSHPLIHQGDWWPASWLAFAGLLAMYVGYVVGLRLLRPAHWRYEFVWRPHASTLLSMILLAVAVIPVAARLRDFGGLGAFVSEFGFDRNPLGVDVPALLAVSLASTALLLQAGNWLSRPTTARALALFGAWLPVTIFLSGTHGARWRVFAVVLALLGVYHLGIRRLRWPAFTLLLAAATILFVLAGGFRYGREVRNVFDPVFHQQYVSSHELGQFRAFVVTVAGVPERLPFQRGATILSLIPRAPFPTAGALFTSTFYPELWAGGANVPTPLPGELYLNFGVPGIIGGMVLFGVGLGLLESYRRRRQGSPGTLVLYAYLLLPVAGMVRGDLTTFLGFSLVTIIPLAIALLFVERRVRTTRVR